MPVVGHGRVLTFLALGVIVAVSLWLGIRRRHGRALLAVNLALALIALPLVAYLASRTSPYTEYGQNQVFSAEPPVVGLNIDGRPIANIYPYTRDGRLLHDVLLYDDAGAPVMIGNAEADPHRRLLTTREGKPALNSFPILYFDPGTQRVADPDATAAPIDVPSILDPGPLRAKKRP